MNNLFSQNDVEKIALFKNLILKNNLSNQLLISCNNKIKLETFATEIIKFLLCQEKKDSDCQCETCQRINNKTYYDLKIGGDFETTIKKETIQEIIQTFSYSALEQTGIKVYVINGADLLTLEAANSLLKFLEEPSKNTYAFLLTRNKTKVIDTIKSRCLNVILENTTNELNIDEFKTKFIQTFFRNFASTPENNFIHIRKLNGYDHLESHQLFLEIANVLKRKEWSKYEITNQTLIKKLNDKNTKLIEISYTIANLLLENLNKELVLEKGMIDLYNEV
ncbi:DNA polymerase III subunit delta' [Spiroplasma poulsonii]|uniref:DNA polymerase III subunit delta n=1 Tax=Spiroplasma poulsonii TaxID=2138 RepID=A0A433ETA5_9MOLU|nr:MULTISPECIES: DNA polymerase III subunit delta' [Spiroplasma]MBH8622728.1 DNA polymerase III subunit delta' [Spiroplasma sp. hyd1]MBW3058017.1 DNA polymerase III subunit delta' [Spiroplasma poulsonii]RUP78139.1 DNA polymerase III subunit delta' [Spiroplasma poulsonii]UNF61281.1 DNA polymerase III subunit delta' [Spiroplasma poulsonii]